MRVAPRLEIPEYKARDDFEFRNAHEVESRLVGDHRFSIRSRGTEVGVGIGDWLSVATDGDVGAEPGGDAHRKEPALTGDGNLSRAVPRRHPQSGLTKVPH